jgi:hypothetical protein
VLCFVVSLDRDGLSQADGPLDGQAGDLAGRVRVFGFVLPPPLGWYLHDHGWSGWQQRHAVVVEAFVARHDRQSFSERLGYQHAVEGILVMVRELTGRDAVSDADRQRHESACLHLLFKVIGCGKLSQRFLDRDLPCVCGRYDDEVGWVGDGVPRWGMQAFVGVPGGALAGLPAARAPTPRGRTNTRFRSARQ